ncbi:hypothetical protein B0H13DRAFT_2666315, partial [Mycena leptocephala]
MALSRLRLFFTPSPRSTWRATPDAPRLAMAASTPTCRSALVPLCSANGDSQLQMNLHAGRFRYGIRNQSSSNDPRSTRFPPFALALPSRAVNATCISIHGTHMHARPPATDAD